MSSFTQDQLRQIAARAELLHERIENGHQGEATKSQEESEIVERFRELYRGSTHGDLEKRLRVLGVDSEELPKYARFDEWPRDEPLPEWVMELDKIVDETLGGTVEPIKDEYRGIPFVHLLQPFTAYALSSSAIESIWNDNLFKASSLADAERWLLHRLSMAIAQPLQVEFRLFKREFSASESEPVDKLNNDDLSEDEAKTEVYDAFIRELLDGEFAAVVRRYPLVGRNLAVIIRQWVEFLTTFAHRLRNDYAEVESRFANGNLGTVTGLNLGRGDLHDRGDTVTEVKFSTGESIYYKPRPINSDVLFEGIVEKLSSYEQCSLSLATPNIFPRDEYGWVEAVEREEIGDNSPTNYYRRIGAILCLYYVFNGSDLHFNNVVAAGDHPVVIDSETLLTRSRLHDFLTDSKADHRLAKYELEDSVFRTALLSAETSVEAAVPDTGGSKMAGLTQIETIETERRRPDWQNVNTDKMTFTVEPVVFSPTSNYPKRDGTPLLPIEYRESILDGFEDVYEFLRQQDPQSFLDDLPVALDSLETRYLFRNTESYFSARFQLCTPRCQKNGVEAALKLERLVPELQILDESVHPVMEKLLFSERVSLYDGNVPRFTIAGTDLQFRGNRIAEGFFDCTHREVAEKRLTGLTKADQKRQCGYILATLSAPDSAESHTEEAANR